MTLLDHNDRLLRIRDAANRAGVCERTIYTWLDQHPDLAGIVVELPLAKGARRIPERLLDLWLARHRKTPEVRMAEEIHGPSSRIDDGQCVCRLYWCGPDLGVVRSISIHLCPAGDECPTCGRPLGTVDLFSQGPPSARVSEGTPVVAARCRAGDIHNALGGPRAEGRP